MSTTALAPRIEELTIAKWRDAGKSLRLAHYNEVASKVRVRAMDPDWAAYERFEAAGMMISLGLFDGDKLVGYSLSIEVPAHLHYRGTHYVQNDLIYVEPSYRGGGAGARLMIATCDAARERGASEMIWHAKKDSPMARVLERRAVLVDLMYSQEL